MPLACELENAIVMDHAEKLRLTLASICILLKFLSRHSLAVAKTLPIRVFINFWQTYSEL